MEKTDKHEEEHIIVRVYPRRPYSPYPKCSLSIGGGNPLNDGLGRNLN